MNDRLNPSVGLSFVGNMGGLRSVLGDFSFRADELYYRVFLSFFIYCSTP